MPRPTEFDTLLTGPASPGHVCSRTEYSPEWTLRTQYKTSRIINGIDEMLVTMCPVCGHVEVPYDTQHPLYGDAMAYVDLILQVRGEDFL